MKRLSDRRIEALALAVSDALTATAGVRVIDRGRAVRAVSKRLSEAFTIDPSLDQAVRARIESLRRSVPEGSREWDLLYQQYLEELSRRR